jgi:acyl-homoserine lactone acylase PvdQ
VHSCLIVAGAAAAWEYNQAGYAWFPNSLHLFMVGGDGVARDPHSKATLAVFLNGKYVQFAWDTPPPKNGLPGVQ